MSEKMNFTTKAYVSEQLKERPDDAHKGTCGKVLIVAGSEGMAGAAVLSGRAAMRSGAGLVRICTEKKLFPIIQTAFIQGTCSDISSLYDMDDFEGYDSVAIGPGLGIDRAKFHLIKKIFAVYKGTIVLDADGLNNLCEFDDKLRSLNMRKGGTILTPHPGECRRILKALDMDRRLISERVKTAEHISRLTETTVVLKGKHTVISGRYEETCINPTGNPGMATGGSGDVLTGVIAAFAASRMRAFEAAKTGVYVHGMAGDICLKKTGQWGMTAVDIEESIPEALKVLVGK